MLAKDIAMAEIARQMKFGYEPSGEDFVIAGQKAGIREVVEWIQEYDHGDGSSVHISNWEWQAKLKEWGI